MKRLFTVILTMLIILLGSSCSCNSPTTGTVPSDSSVEINRNYEPLRITDTGGFYVADDDCRYYSLEQVIDLLRERNIPIIDMKGSQNLNTNEGGSIRLDALISTCDFDFDKATFSTYDIALVANEFKEHDLHSVYIETPWEIFSFRASGGGNSFPDIAEFSVSTIRISHPEYTTDKGIKIGDTLEQVQSLYDTIVFDNRNTKQPDEDWSVSFDVGSYTGFITFTGDDTGVKYVDVGGLYFFAD